MLAAEKRNREDLADVLKTFYVGIVDDRNVVIKRFKRRAEHAGVSDASQQENNADKRDIVFGDLRKKIVHD